MPFARQPITPRSEGLFVECPRGKSRNCDANLNAFAAGEEHFWGTAPVWNKPKAGKALRQCPRTEDFPPPPQRLLTMLSD